MDGRLIRVVLALSTSAFIACYEVHSMPQPQQPADTCFHAPNCWCPDNPVATLTLSPSTVDFGLHPNGSSTDLTLTVTNAGTVTTPNLSGDIDEPPYDSTFTFAGGRLDFPGTGGTCVGTLAPGQSCTVVLTYAPTADNGGAVHSAWLDLYPAGPAVCQIQSGGGGAGGGPQLPMLRILLTGTD